MIRRSRWIVRVVPCRLFLCNRHLHRLPYQPAWRDLLEWGCELSPISWAHAEINFEATVATAHLTISRVYHNKIYRARPHFLFGRIKSHIDYDCTNQPLWIL